MVTENRLIAEFMGYEFVDGDFRIPHSDKTTNSNFSEWCSTYGDIDGMFSVGYLLAPSNLMFHSDWNWLMEVVLKINMVDDYRYTVQINSMDTYIHDLKYGGFIFQSEMKWQSDELINSVYEAVVEFIKWYNEQK